MIDISDATDRMISLLASVSEDQFDRLTPCPDARLGDLVDHVGSFAKGFTAVAEKTSGESDRPTRPSAANLEPGWRDRVTHDLRMCAEAWKQTEAWEGMSYVGGLELPGEVAGLVVLDELVVHGWDIAKATGQSTDFEPATVAAARSGYEQAPVLPRGEGKPFREEKPAPAGATDADRLAAFLGRTV